MSNLVSKVIWTVFHCWGRSEVTIRGNNVTFTVVYHEQLGYM